MTEAPERITATGDGWEAEYVRADKVRPVLRWYAYAIWGHDGLDRTYAKHWPWEHIEEPEGHFYKNGGRAARHVLKELREWDAVLKMEIADAFYEEGER